MPRLYAILGKQIAHLRRRADLTQEQLAEKTGYSVDFISLVERGINAPTVARLQDIAEALGVEVWQLFKFQDGQRKTLDTLRRNSGRTRDVLGAKR